MFLVLFISGGTLLCGLLSFAGVTAVIVRIVMGLLPTGFEVVSFWKSVAVMMLVTLITAVMHLIEITLWAVVFMMCGEMATFEMAFYFSAENYTALGYENLLMSGQWRILGPLEAINGLLLIGLSTAGMFAILNRLIENRLRRQGGYWSEGPEKRPSMSDCAGVPAATVNRRGYDFGRESLADVEH
jgi:hypothetical protein